MYKLHRFNADKPRVSVKANVAGSQKTFKKASLRTLDSLPMEAGLPLLGTAAETIKLESGQLSRYFKKHKSDVIMSNRGILGGPVLAIGDKELIHEALSVRSKDIQLSWSDSVSAGLFPAEKPLTLDESKSWRRVLSKILQPEFVMRAQLPAVLKSASSVIRSVGKGEVQMYNEVRRITYTVACKAAVGDILSKQDIDTMFPLACTYGAGVMVPDLGLPFGPYHSAMKAKQEIIDLLAARISAYLSSLDSITGGGDDCLLSLLISGLQEEGMLSGTLSSSPDGELVQRLAREVLFLLFAGTDTTSIIISSMLQFLCKYPEWLDRVWLEQQELMREFGGDIDRRVLSRSNVALAVVQETLRLRTAVPAVMRKAVRDTVLGDIAIPKGTEIALAIYHSTKQTGNGSEEFNPQQWLSEGDSKVASNQDSMVFGYGPRNCVGSNLAMCDLLCTLVVLAREVKEVRMSDSDRDAEVTSYGHPTGMPTTLVPR